MELDEDTMDAHIPEFANLEEGDNTLDFAPNTAEEDLSQDNDMADCDAADDAIPNKSRNRYKQKYIQFQRWLRERKRTECTEDVVMDYFKELSLTKTPSTLWSSYSMLRPILKTVRHVDISKFTKLMAFLKDKGKGYVPDKAKAFTSDMIVKFLETAPDSKYLATKVVAIFGILGACRTEEIVNATMDNIEIHGSLMLVRIPKPNPSESRSFTISDKHFLIVQKYLNLRPEATPTNRVFLYYNNGACTRQPIGKNSLAKMPKSIADFLGLPNPKGYTGHSFRRTSATLLANAGADLFTLRRHGGWKSSSVIKGYLEESVEFKQSTETLITSKINEAAASFGKEPQENHESEMESLTNPNSNSFEHVLLPCKQEIESPPPIEPSEESTDEDDCFMDGICMDSEKVVLVFPPEEQEKNEDMNHNKEENPSVEKRPYPPKVLAALKQFTFNNCNVTIKMNCKKCHP